MNKKGQVMGIVSAILVCFVLVFVMFTFGYVNIAPTDVGVEIDKMAGKVKTEPLTVGYHFYNRFTTDITMYKVAARSYPNGTAASESSKEYTLELKTNDGQNMNLDLTIIYALNAKLVPELHQQVGRNYEDQIILPQIRSEARLAIGAFSAEEIYRGKARDEIQSQIRTRLQQSLVKYPAIQIQDALMRHFSFSPDFERAIEQKKMAAQQVEINKNLALAQEEQAKQVEAQARGLKLKAVQEAEGEAQSRKINADATRYQLEQEAAGQLAKLKADAEGKRLLVEAMGGEGGKNVVALKWAEQIPDKLQIWGIPTGGNSTSLMDMSGLFGKMLGPRNEEK